MAKTRKVLTSLYLDLDTIDRVKELARRKGWKISAMYRALMDYAVECFENEKVESQLIKILQAQMEEIGKSVLKTLSKESLSGEIKKQADRLAFLTVRTQRYAGANYKLLRYSLEELFFPEKKDSKLKELRGKIDTELAEELKAPLRQIVLGWLVRNGYPDLAKEIGIREGRERQEKLMGSSKAKEVSRLVEVGITQRRFYLQTLRYLFLWLVIIHIASVGFFSWREWQKPMKDSYPRIIAGLLKYVSQSEKYSWVDWMLGREKPGDIEKCLGYVNLYTKKWLIIASRKAFWWEAGWSALFCVSLAVRGRRRAQKTRRGMEREDGLTLRSKKGRIIIPCRRQKFLSPFPSYFKIPYEYENLGLLVLGASGFGKTVFLNYLLKSILENKPYNDHEQKIIIHDAKGDFTSYFHGRDDTVLFSFTDPRGVSWNLLQDLFSFQFKPSLEVGGIASCLIPPGDDIWRVGARQIVSGMLLHILLTKHGKVSNADIRNFLQLTPKETYDVLMQLPETQRYALPLQKAEAESNVSFSLQ